MQETIYDPKTGLHYKLIGDYLKAYYVNRPVEDFLGVLCLSLPQSRPSADHIAVS